MHYLREKNQASKVGFWKVSMVVFLIFFMFAGSAAYAADVLFIVGQKKMKAVDETIKTHLQDKGFNVSIVHDILVSEQDTVGKDLIVISDSVLAKNIEPNLANTNIPLICSEAMLFDDLGMTAETRFVDFGRKTKQSQVKIALADHPLTASLSDDVHVSTEGMFMGWGVPSDDAIKVAMMKGDQTRYPIFAYDSGARMSQQIAPAKRVGFFLNNNIKGSITSDGWALFNAAVDWAVSESSTVAKMN